MALPHLLPPHICPLSGGFVDLPSIAVDTKRVVLEFLLGR